MIKNEQEYENALARVYTLMQLDKEKHYQIALPSPINAITFGLEQLGKEKRELASIIGTRARQSEMLGSKRNLSLAMICDL